jgi:hypothetical protein
MGLSPFEIVFGQSPPLVKDLQGDFKETGDLTLRQQIQALHWLSQKSMTG